jgi:DNA-binding NtrC family response regulator
MADITLNKDSEFVIEKPGILYVDDEANNLVAFRAAFRRKFEIYTAISADAAKEYLDKDDLCIIISDQRMPGQTGVEFFSEIKKTHPKPIRILLTGYSDMEAVVNAINKGEVYRYLNKPWDAESLLSILHQAIELFTLREDNKRLLEELKRANSQLEFYLRQKLLF